MAGNITTKPRTRRARPAAPSGILRLSIQSRAVLQACVMPGLAGGGFFVPTTEPYALGDDVCLVVGLMSDTTTPVLGRVVWVTPEGAAHHRMQGIGVQLTQDENAARVQSRVAALLPNGREPQGLTHTF